MNSIQINKPAGMPRHLTLIAQPVYEGFALLPVNGPHVLQYLERLISVVDAALAQSSKIFAIRIDLHLPQLFDGQPEYSNQVIESFVKAMRARIDSEKQRRLRSNSRVSEPQFRYVWAREQVSAAQPHYHLLLIFNANFFQQLGRVDDDFGLSGMIFAAWASVIGLPIEQVRQFVHFPKQPAYFVDRDNEESQSALLMRASYLCKSASKRWSDGFHVYGASKG